MMAARPGVRFGKFVTREFKNEEHIRHLVRQVHGGSLMRKKIPALAILIIFMGLSAWSPWLTQAGAETRAVNSFNKSWESVIDGCGTNCLGCGAISSRRVLFGSVVTMEYACGLIPEDTPEYHYHATAFVSALGTVHGLPKP